MQVALASGARKALKRIVLGAVDFPQQCPIGLPYPQSEVTVRLHGLDAQCDVTYSHLMACGAPFTIGIGFDEHGSASIDQNARLFLAFAERNEPHQLLGTIGLQLSSVIPAGTQRLFLFKPTACRNRCLPRPRIWARHLHYAWERSRKRPADMSLTAREAHSMFVFYICPRPVVLVSVTNGTSNNMFPMNLMGSIGNGYFAFALNSTKPAAALVRRSEAMVLSHVPIERFPLVYDLAKNHRRETLDWSELPVETRRSPVLGIPVPEFALRIDELRIERAYDLGSHTLFVARVIHEQRVADGAEFFVVHGMYQAWRQTRRGV